ncbi:hypothetical protein KUTeg_010722 [Tegillarca granosa]|uniref:Cadherin domain-containing protein n=1 Tax=Tegillarca granosa TaxID=220873 RepID=A0ABQ9F650_TEGGR|nr:hypothetical protein KUTeg_010722 [Tegillarca granosa]
MEMIMRFVIFLAVFVCPVVPLISTPYSPDFHFSILEEQPIGTYVGRIQGTACPTNKIYSLFPASTPFAINQNGGITTTQLLDREKSSIYRLMVQEKCGGTTVYFTVYISILDVNDNAPIFFKSHDETLLSVNSPVGTIVYTSIAYDVDTGVNSQIQYSLQQLDPPLFAINPYTGMITLSAPMNADFRSRTLTIIATDGGIPPLSNKMTLQIHITVP